MLMGLGILGVVTFITVIFISRKWWLPTIIATFMGVIFFLFFPSLTFINPWTCQPTSTFPINPQSRILCAPERGMIDHWRFAPDGGNKKISRTAKYVTISAQQGIEYISIYNRSVKLYNACIDGVGTVGRGRGGEGYACSAHYFDRGSYTPNDISDLLYELREEEREFYRQFPVLGDKRPWMD
jgi:hypothetical protein